MATYIVLTRFNQDALENPEELKALAEDVSTRIEEECPDVDWKRSYMTLGSYDVVDIVESDDPAQVMRAALIIRTQGRGHTETMQAYEWNSFLDELE